jgi:Flp pilus assembly pilin Flp
MNAISKFVRQEEGASAAEYALMLGVVATVVFVALVALRGEIVRVIGIATAVLQGIV